MVFDKTGTLTEDGLSVHSSKIRYKKSFLKKFKSDLPIPVPANVYLDKDIYSKNKNDIMLKFVECMASCHQVTLLNGQ